MRKNRTEVRRARISRVSPKPAAIISRKKMAKSVQHARQRQLSENAGELTRAARRRQFRQKIYNIVTRRGKYHFSSVACLVLIAVSVVSVGYAFFSDLVRYNSAARSGYLCAEATLKIDGQIGDRMLTPSCPYAAVEYLQFDGDSWIDTGVDQTGNIRVTADFQYTVAPTSGNLSDLFGAGRTADGSSFALSWNVQGGNNHFAANYRAAAPMFAPGGLNRYRLAKYNGTTILTPAGGGAPMTNVQADNPIAAGTIQNITVGRINGLTGRNFIGKVYAFAIDKGGTSGDRDFAPAYNTLTGQCGLYDKISGDFLTNAGGGELTCPRPAANANCDNLLCRGDNQGSTGILAKPNTIHEFSYTLKNTGTVAWRNYTGDRISAWLNNLYMPVDHLQFTGNSYINTGVAATNLNGIVIKADASMEVLGASRYLFGARDCTANGCTTNAILFGADASNKFSVYRNGQNVAIASGAPAADAGRYVYTYNTTSATRAATTIATYSAGNNFTSANNFFIHGYNNNGADVAGINGVAMTFYSFTIANNSGLVRDMIPVKNNQTGQCGFFDRVQGKFYGNAGAGDITCYNPIENNPLRVLLFPGDTDDADINADIASLQGGGAATHAIANLSGNCLSSDTFYGTDDGIAACSTGVLAGTPSDIYLVGAEKTYTYKFVIWAPLNVSQVYTDTVVNFGVASGAQGIPALNWKMQLHPWVSAATPIGNPPSLNPVANKTTFPFIGQVTDATAYLQSLVASSDIEDGACTFGGNLCAVSLLSDDGFDPNQLGVYNVRYQVVDSDGNKVNLVIPVQVVKIVNVVAGVNSALALDSAGRTFSFGSNSNSQLGAPIGSAAGQLPNPTYKPTLNMASVAQLVSAEQGLNHGIGIDRNGQVWTWGLNGDGQLGHGNTTTQTTPKQIATFPSGATFVQVGAGYNFSMALDSGGKLWVWGQGGYLGLGTSTTDILTPTILNTFAGGAAPFITQFSTGYTGDDSPTLAAVDRDGNIWVWGSSDYGAAGTTTNSRIATPLKLYDAATGNWYNNSGAIINTAVAVPAGTKMLQVRIGNGFGAARDAAGNLYTWGSNIQRNLGNGSTNGNDRNPPGKIYDAATGNFLLASGAVNTSASTGAGAMVTLGSNNSYGASFAIDSVGNLYSWGDNNDGALGTGSSTDNPNPRQIYAVATGQFYNNTANLPAGTKIVQVASDDDAYALILAENGAVFGVGDGGYGKNGLGTTGAVNSSFVKPWVTAGLPSI